MGQPAAANFPSPPQSLSPVQHKFTSKMVCDPASLSPLGAWAGERITRLGQGCPSFPNPLALPARGMDGDSGTWLGEDKGVVLGVCKKGGPCSGSFSTGDPP